MKLVKTSTTVPCPIVALRTGITSAAPSIMPAESMGCAFGIASSLAPIRVHRWLEAWFSLKPRRNSPIKGYRDRVMGGSWT